MTEVKPYMCSCCNDIWSRENQKSIKLGKYELHLCPDCYHEYIISNNAVLKQIRAEQKALITINSTTDYSNGVMNCLNVIDKYMKGEQEC